VLAVLAAVVALLVWGALRMRIHRRTVVALVVPVSRAAREPEAEAGGGDPQLPMPMVDALRHLAGLPAGQCPMPRCLLRRTRGTRTTEAAESWEMVVVVVQ